MKLLLKLLVVLPLMLTLLSCSYLLTDHGNDYLKEKQTAALVLPEGQQSKPIVDYYPINTLNPEKVGETYEVPMPQQIFSSGTSNEVRMHKLGELRWVYVETLPSSAWPIMKDFWVSSQYGLGASDPNTGHIESESISIQGIESKLVMKIEHGIRQASSEIFVSHITQQDNDWIRLEGEGNLEENILRSVLDYFASTPSTGGTSLVALNLNYGQKAVLKQTNNKSSYIELNLEYSRAWAAVDRALKEALIKVNDLDRDEGVFYVGFSKEEEKGFFRSIVSRKSYIGNYRVVVKEMDNNVCWVTIDSDEEESQLYLRDLLSEINQSLS